MEPPSIADVATQAGVSTATVSRAMRGLANVHPATAARVRAVAEELGYSATPAAASLASGATRTIAIVCSQLNTWFVANVCQAIVRSAHQEGFSSSVHVLGMGTRTEAWAGSRLPVQAGKLRRRADAVIVVGLPLLPGEQAELEALAVPVIFVGPAVPGKASVHIDEYGSAREATRFLLSKGHRTIAHITGPAEDDSESGPPLLRLRGYLDALAAAGIAADYELMGHCDYTRQAAQHVARDILRTRPDVSAVLGFSDVQAAGALAAAREQGRRVPEEIAILGIDGSDLADAVGISTLAQDPIQQGEAALTLALDLLTGAPVPDNIVFPTTLIERSTT